MPRPVLALSLVAALAAADPSSAHRPPLLGPTVELELASGRLEVELVPDRGSPLPLETSDGRRWVLRGDPSELIGRSYSIELANRSPERLKVVVSVDGLNVYDRVPVIGRSDRDVGSILGPWSERCLRGWQVGLEVAERFVLSPSEWSEGRGVTDGAIGLIEIQVYRERWAEPLRDRAAAGPASELKQRSTAESVAAPAPGLGTTSGDEVSSPVRVVHFDARTVWPEARAEVDYGRRPERGDHPPEPAPVRLGIDVAGEREGTRVLAVRPGSAADQAGLAPGDLVARADAVRRPTPADLRRLVDGKRAGDHVFLWVRRGPHELSLKIRLD